MLTRQSHKRFAIFLGAFYAAWILRVLLLPIDASFASEWTRQCWAQGLRILLWILPVFAFLAWSEKTNPLSYSKANVLPRGNRLVLGALLTLAFLVLVFFAGLVFQGGNISNFSQVTMPGLARLVVSMTIVACAEEILFRGFVFQYLRHHRPFLIANALTTLLFLAIHWPGWFYHYGASTQILELSLGVLFAGWIFGWLMELTQSLCPPILAHLLNNILATILIP